MSGRHTQGRLEAVDTTILFRSDQGIIVGGINIAALPEPIANARRLAACWNACDGSTTEDLERLGSDFIAPWVKLFDEVEAARALLEEASKRQHTDSWEAALGQNTLDDRIRAFLKGDA